MRWLKPILGAAGLAVIVLVVARVGTEPIITTLRQVTWWQLVLVCLPYAAIMAVETLGWRFAFAGRSAPYARLLGARLGRSLYLRLNFSVRVLLKYSVARRGALPPPIFRHYVRALATPADRAGKVA